MNLKNKNSKINTIIKSIAIFMIVAGIVHFTSYIKIMQLELKNILFLFTGIFYILIGIRRTVAKNNKSGCFDYFLGMLFLYAFIDNL